MSSARFVRPAWSVLRLSVAVFVAGGAVLASAPARAGTPCTQDSDCTQGFSCQIIGAGTCPASGPPATCAVGDVCDASVTYPSPCDAQVVRACEPGPCTTDTDCASGMECHATITKSCSSTACAKDSDADCVPATTCTNVGGPSSCIPKYELPCTVDADCGDHFACTPGTTISCWGSGGSVSGDAGARGTQGGSGVEAPTPVAADAGSVPTSGCTTMPSGTSSCVPNTINCTTDSDCPATWSCSGSLSSGIAAPGCAGGAEGADGAVSVIPCAPLPPAPPPSVCVPPSYGGTLTTSPSGSSRGASADGGSFSSAPSGTPTTGTAPTASTAPTTPTTTTTQAGNAATPTENSGGCGVGGGATGAAGWLFAAAMAFGLVTRRRASERKRAA